MTHDILRLNILKEFGFDRATPDEQEKFLLSFGKVLYEGVLLGVMEMLDDAAKDAFERTLSTANSEEDIYAFLRAHVPGFDGIVLREIARLKGEMLRIAKRAA